MAVSHGDEIGKLEKLFADNPEGRVFTHLAEAYRKAGDLDRAEEVLQYGLERHSEYSSAHVVHGRVLADQGKRKEAASSFRRVLELDPHNMVALRSLADLHVSMGDWDAAVSYYRDLLALDPGNPEVEELVERVESGELAGDGAASGSPGSGAAESDYGVIVPSAEPLEDADSEPFEYAGSRPLDDDLPEPLDDAGFEALDDAGADAPEEMAVAPADSRDSFVGVGAPDEADPGESPAEYIAVASEAGLEATEPFEGGSADDEDAPPEDAYLAEPASEAPEGSLAEPASEAPETSLSEPAGIFDAEPDEDMEVATETMGDLYLRQGLHSYAAEVYRRLLRHRPSDDRLRQKLEDAERGPLDEGGEQKAEQTADQTPERPPDREEEPIVQPEWGDVSPTPSDSPDEGDSEADLVGDPDGDPESDFDTMPELHPDVVEPEDLAGPEEAREFGVESIGESLLPPEADEPATVELAGEDIGLAPIGSDLGIDDEESMTTGGEPEFEAAPTLQPTARSYLQQLVAWAPAEAGSEPTDAEEPAPGDGAEGALAEEAAEDGFIWSEEEPRVQGRERAEDPWSQAAHAPAPPVEEPPATVPEPEVPPAVPAPEPPPEWPERETPPLVPEPEPPQPPERPAPPPPAMSEDAWEPWAEAPASADTLGESEPAPQAPAAEADADRLDREAGAAYLTGERSGAAAEESPAPEPRGEHAAESEGEDEDLEMFRSWLDNLKR